MLFLSEHNLIIIISQLKQHCTKFTDVVKSLDRYICILASDQFVSMSVCACMCVCVCVCTVYACVHVCCVCTCVCARVCVSLCVHARVCVRACMVVTLPDCTYDMLGF